MALAPIGRRNISAGSVAPKSATTTTSLASICFATLRKPHGVKITAASPMALRWPALRRWR